ncbi:hypothetical protein J4573_31350 [Actinomadura barringtoniae]|uniref:Uncharacterized protein n=1 Tax=Actinomadura barringtoniae TaxID=1427535 RepID=A0A939PK82_9ACTN|nr:hypothetical protein [Actinomadura barringtoniae]MBO2451623.1 hypothetical protein [Actinomadura barringtoniae]
MTTNSTGEATGTPTRSGYTDNALDVAETTFNLLITGPAPLALDGTGIGHGLPARMIDLGELRAIVLGPDTNDALKDAVWRELVTCARAGEPSWVIGCVGMALPGLKNAAAGVIATSPRGLADDIVSELLTEFLAQLPKIDIDRGHIGARLVCWARKGAFRARGHNARHTLLDARRVPWLMQSPERIEPELAALLAEAVHQEVISASAADLINATRLQGMSVTDYARTHGLPAARLLKRRARAEARLAAAITEGQVQAITAELVSDPGC